MAVPDHDRESAVQDAASMRVVFFRRSGFPVGFVDEDDVLNHGKPDILPYVHSGARFAPLILSKTVAHFAEGVRPMAFPMFRNAKPLRKHDLGGYEAILLTDIESVGMVQYLYILSVHKKGEERPVFTVTAEENMLAQMGGPGNGSHFLCAFDQGQHLNFGASDDYAMLDRFEKAALAKARERLRV